MEKELVEREYHVTVRLRLKPINIEEGLALAKQAISTMGLDIVKAKYISETRSESQRNSSHLWWEQLEAECEKKEVTMDMIIKKPAEIPVTANLIKDLFRFTGKKMFGKESTADHTKKEFQTLVKLFDKIFLELGVDVEFPNRELQIRGKKVR